MNSEKETLNNQTIDVFDFGNLQSDDFDSFLIHFDWSLQEDKSIEQLRLKFSKKTLLNEFNLISCLFILYIEFLSKNGLTATDVSFFGHQLSWKGLNGSLTAKDLEIDEKSPIQTLIIHDTEDREKALEFGIKFTENLDVEYEKTLRYFLNELLYNTIEHGRNSPEIPSLLQFFWNEESSKFSFIVADVGVGIRQHLRQTYPNLSTDSEAILHSIKPQISGTFGRPRTGYETKNNAGVGLFFSSNIAQRLNADMFIVSGNGFVHISPTEIIAKELDNQWKGTFVYVKMKLDLIKDLNFQKMLAEITKSIPKAVEVTQENNLQISVMNYFGKYAEDKDLAKKIRDKYLLPALAENKSLTIDFEDIVSAPHSLLNAMLATPIERLGLSAYKKIKIINAAPEIRETLDFIFDDNTSNA
jgi:STAS-like domain of unknown function (DUF4325)